MTHNLPQLSFLSENVLLLRFGTEISVETTRVIQRWIHVLSGDTAVATLVPTYCDIAVTVSDLARAWSLSDWQVHLSAVSSRATLSESKNQRLRVCFGSMPAALEEYASAVRLAPSHVIDVILSTEFSVGMLGFLPGMPYLIGLPEPLHCPRRNDLIKAPANTLAIGGKQIGVLPSETITGWWPIAQVSEPLFDLAREPMNRLQVGDSVRFLKH